MLFGKRTLQTFPVHKMKDGPWNSLLVWQKWLDRWVSTSAFQWCLTFRGNCGPGRLCFSPATVELRQMKEGASTPLAFLTTSYTPVTWVSNRIPRVWGGGDPSAQRRCFLWGPVSNTEWTLALNEAFSALRTSRAEWVFVKEGCPCTVAAHLEAFLTPLHPMPVVLFVPQLRQPTCLQTLPEAPLWGKVATAWNPLLWSMVLREDEIL